MSIFCQQPCLPLFWLLSLTTTGSDNGHLESHLCTGQNARTLWPIAMDWRSVCWMQIFATKAMVTSFLAVTAIQPKHLPSIASAPRHFRKPLPSTAGTALLCHISSYCHSLHHLPQTCQFSPF